MRGSCFFQTARIKPHRVPTRIVQSTVFLVLLAVPTYVVLPYISFEIYDKLGVAWCNFEHTELSEVARRGVFQSALATNCHLNAHRLFLNQSVVCGTDTCLEFACFTPASPEVQHIGAVAGALLGADRVFNMTGLAEWGLDEVRTHCIRDIEFITNSALRPLVVSILAPLAGVAYLWFPASTVAWVLGLAAAPITSVSFVAVAAATHTGWTVRNALLLGACVSILSLMISGLAFSMLPALRWFRGLSPGWHVFCVLVFTTPPGFFTMAWWIRHSGQYTDSEGRAMIAIATAEMVLDVFLLLRFRRLCVQADAARRRLRPEVCWFLRKSIREARVHIVLVLLGSTFCNLVRFGVVTYEYAQGVRGKGGHARIYPAATLLICLAGSVPAAVFLCVEIPSWKMCGVFRRATKLLRSALVIPADTEATSKLNPDENMCFCFECLDPPLLRRAEHAGFLSWLFGRPAREPPVAPLMLSAPDAGDAAAAATAAAVPIGWCRFALKAETPFGEEPILSHWLLAYHGTACDAVSSILAHSQLLIPGDYTLRGKQLSIREGHIEGQRNVYVSPSLQYASHPIYAFPAESDGERFQIVFECRVRPGSYTVQHGTLPVAENFQDPLIPFESLEWFTSLRMAVIPTAILIRKAWS